MVQRSKRKTKSRHTLKPKARGARVVHEPKQLDESLGELGKEGMCSVKLKLASVVKDPEPGTKRRKNVLSRIGEWVVYSSKASHRGGEMEKEALVEFCTCPDRTERYGSIGKLLQSQTFYRQLLYVHHNKELYTRDGPGGRQEKLSPLVQEIRRKFMSGPAPFEPMPDRGPEASILAQKAKEHMTAMLNHFELNLEIYQEKTIKAFFREHLGKKPPQALVDRVRQKLVGEDVDISGDWDPADDLLNTFIDQHRAQLGFPSLEEEEESNESAMPDDFYASKEKSLDKKDARPWTKKNLDTVVLYFHWMTEGLQNDYFGKRAPQACLCPSYDVKAHHLVIDSTLLLKILLSLDEIDDDTKGGTDLNKDKGWKSDSVKERYWARWFDYLRYEVNNERVFKSFHFYLTTDGRSVSLVFDVQRIIMDAAIPREHDKFLEHHSDPNSLSHTDYQLGGGDPGVVNVLTVAIELGNGEFKCISLTLGHYRNNALITASQRADVPRRERAARKEYHDACNQFSRKTVDRSELDQFRELMHQEGEDGTSLYDRIWEEKLRSTYREWKFRVYRASKRTLAKHVASLRGEGEAPLIILYGNGSWGRPKGNPAAPNKKMLEECKRQHVVIMVDEWMSSQTCPNCGSRFPKTVKKPAPGEKFNWRRHSVRGLLYCSNKNCTCACYWDRDVVGARCIFIIGTTQPENLPKMLRRDLADQRPERGYHVLHV